MTDLIHKIDLAKTRAIAQLSVNEYMSTILRDKRFGLLLSLRARELVMLNEDELLFTRMNPIDLHDLLNGV